MDPSEELAEKIVTQYWGSNLRPKQAVRRGFEEAEIAQPPGFDLEEDWQDVWASMTVTEKLGDHRDTVQQDLKNRVPGVVAEIEELAFDDEVSPGVKERLLTWLAETAGVSPKKEIEVTHKNEFETMGVEETVEWIESNIPLYCEECGSDVHVDTIEWVRGSF